MERTALAPRAARKSEWLRSALAHHHCPDPGADNEIVVLATGVDQYLQEVFHHLVHPSRDDAVSAEDFTALCAVLGLAAAEKENRTTEAGAVDGGKGEEDEEFGDACSALPCRLSFKDFHSRLCGHFRVRSARGRGAGECAGRLPVTEDTELVERQIRLRWPRVRRRKCVSFDLARDHRSVKGRTPEDRESEEVAALRELVEDLRSALQGSDARCLALEVALRRERSHTLPPTTGFNIPASTPTTSITLELGKLVPTRRIKGHCGGAVGDATRRAARRRDIRDPLERELKLIRSSRDGQLEEAMKFNKCLEEELCWAYQEVRKLYGSESALRNENAHIRRRAEEAREALSLGLQRVRTIQEQAQSVPQLQSRITQLEAELHQYRSRCACILDPDHHEMYPIGAADACSKTECLQRAVEGKASSDEEEEEEEEDSGTREGGQCSLLEAKKHQPHGCGKGCQSHTVHQVVPQSYMHDRNLSSRGRRSWKGPSQEQPEGSRCLQKEKRTEEEEDETRSEEREKTRLSLLEDKLTDALTLLLQLRNKNVSRRALGKIVMDTLDVCSRSGDGPSQILQIADALCVRLSSRDLLGNGGEDEGGVPSSGCKTSSVNPLLISC
ncbi:EF-hand and coiled-coil domain-containing protein 1 [Cyclopterus lumpus]|uniref:EF-hand and coiled-coil domain-containing protein 1-like n=1 Tax=Cyclopterus lumpus TaxID=8103 RepID=A0A8C3AA97_CYCLU|nr:EF-hand and coiled-coil domain-containing protein 1 [Cyclopterus lumpus]